MRYRQLQPMYDQYPICIAHVHSVPHLYSPYPESALLYSPVPSVTHLYNSCPESIPSLKPMSSLQPSSMAHIQTSYLKLMSNQYPISTTNVQSVPHLYSPCPVSIPSSKPISRHQYPIVVSLCPAFAYLYSQWSESTLSLQYKSRHNPISTCTYITHHQRIYHLVPKSHQNTTSPIYYQLELYFSCPGPFSKSFLLPLSSQNTTSMPMSSQNTISHTFVQ